MGGKENRRISISAVITTYKRDSYLKRALASILEQTYQPDEILIIDDGSPIDYSSWINDMHNSKIKYFKHEKNKGLSAARNLAIEKSNCEFIAFLDDDDVWKPEKLEVIVERIKESIGNLNVAVYYSGNEVHYVNSELVTNFLPINQGNLQKSIMKYGARTPPSTFVFSKSALRKCGGYDENLKSSVDHDIWMNFAVNGYSAIGIMQPLVIVYERTDRKTMMSNTMDRLKGVQQYVEKWLDVYKEWFGEKEGISYSSKYLSKVIGALITQKIIEKKFYQACLSLLFVLKNCRIKHVAIINLMEAILKGFIKLIIGKRNVNFLRLKRMNK